MNEFDELLNQFRPAPREPEPVAAPPELDLAAAAAPELDPPSAASPQELEPTIAAESEGEPVATASLDGAGDVVVPTATEPEAAAESDATESGEDGESNADKQLRAFQERLNERLGQAGAVRQTKLGVEAGGRLWLVELSEAGEIVAVPPNFAVVPLTHSWLRGLVNLRGSLHAVTDLADFLGEPPSVVGRESRLLVFASRLNLNAALLVDRMLGLQDMAALTLVSDPDGADACEWVDAKDRHWHELSLQQLAVDERFLVAAR